MRRSHARNRVKSNSKLNSSSESEMDPIKLQMRSSTRSTNLFSRPPKHARPSGVVIGASIAAAISVTLFCYVFIFSAGETKKFSIIIDGGSTGTRIHVFGYTIDRGNTASFDLGGGRGLASLKVNPGLSAYAEYAEDAEGAGASLSELLEFAKMKVPRTLWGETEIRLMATAGMRMLEATAQERVLESCRRALRTSGFKFRDEWASVITGFDEGVYAWIIANYALGTLGGDPLQTTGIIELGGASAQVTFVSSEAIPSEFSREIRFGNVTYKLYSHSFLHFGQNVALESLRESLLSGDIKLAAESLQKEMYLDPCTPKGYLHDRESGKLPPGALSGKSDLPGTLQARGNFSECRSAALHLLQKGKEKCSHGHCYLGSTFMPKLQGKFLATENFFYTSKFFGLQPRGFLSDLVAAGERFCGEDWPKLRKKHRTLDEEDLLRYCFSSAYIVALLHDSLGIPLDDQRIEFANEVESIPLDWALGAFIFLSSTDLNMQKHHWITSIIRDDPPTLLSFIAFSAIVMFIGWTISKWRKPQLKTVYDLEKGRYIITRVNRTS